jgi:hypothetical protein
MLYFSYRYHQPTTACALKKVWPEITLHIVADAGHSSRELGITKLLVEVTALTYHLTPNLTLFPFHRPRTSLLIFERFNACMPDRSNLVPDFVPTSSIPTPM